MNGALGVTADSAAAVLALDAAVTSYLNISRDTMARIDKALEIDPGLLMGHCLKGYMQALTNKPEWNDRIAASLAAARTSQAERGATTREAQHVEALEALYIGNLLKATAIWESVLIDHPLDVVALKIAHLHYFRLGDMPNLRDTSTRVAHAWDPSVPAYGNILGIRSFGLMETGDYRAAEDVGTHAVELAPARPLCDSRSNPYPRNGRSLAGRARVAGRPRAGVGLMEQFSLSRLVALRIVSDRA